jgi:uncharacterized protein YggE
VKRALAAILTVVAVLFAANMLGVAVAEAPTVAALRTISVQGTATLPIGQDDKAAEATAVYREATAAAIVDGQSKAAFLAGKLGSSLSAVQSVVEDGGYINCTAAGETEYAEYEGEEPDFGYGRQTNVGAVVPTSVAAPSKESSSGATPKPRLKKRKHRHTTAKKAAAGSCKLQAQVSLIYAIA